MGDRRPVVLIVEDDRNIRELMREALMGAGLQVLEAPDGLAAVRLAADRRPDAVVLDIGLPLLDGVEVADRIGKLEGPPIPIVVVSAAGRASDAARIRCVAEIVKPFEIDDLVSAVTGAVELPRTADAAQPRPAES